MPQKRNHAGNMQNYVPAGNGDASGEYGDNATGSNVHFKTFKKPDEESQETKAENTTITTKETTKDTNNVVKTATKADKETITNNLINKFKEKDKDKGTELSNKIVSESNDNIQVLNNMIEENEKLTITYGGTGRNASGCAWGYSSVNLSGQSVKTARHEIGHIWDSFYGANLEDNKEKYPFSHRVVTRYIDDVEKKSFDEVIHEELGINGYDTILSGWSIRYKKRGVDKREDKKATMERISKVFNDYCDTIFDELSGVSDSNKKLKELRTKKKELNDKLIDAINNDKSVKEIGEKYDEANSNVYRAEAQYSKEKMQSGAPIIIYSQSKEVMDARRKRDELRNEYSEIRDQKRQEFSKQYGFSKEEQDMLDKLERVKNFGIYKRVEGIASIMGDTEDYMGVSGTGYTTLGHGSNYFNQRKDDGYSCEVWANMFDCYLDKDEKTWGVVKQMLPRATAVFERAIKKFGGRK